MSAAPIAFFPAAHSEELLYSVVARYHSLTAQRDSVSINRLFATTRISPTLPGKLDFLRDATGGCLGSSEDVIHRHTTLPYYRPFLSTAAADTMVAKMRHGHLVRAAETAGVPGNQLRLLRLCPICVGVQLERDGASFWRRGHQLPGVLVCPEHEADLIDSCPKCGGFHTRHSRFTILRVPHGRCPKCGTASAPTYRLREETNFGEGTKRFARMSDALLRSQLVVPGDLRTQVYHERLDALGAPLRNAQQFPRWIWSQLETTYASTLLRQLGFAKANIGKLPMLFVHSSQRRVPPAVHLALIGITFGSLDAYAKAVEAFGAKAETRSRVPVMQLLHQQQFDLAAAAKATNRSPNSLVDALLAQRAEIAPALRASGQRDKLIASAAACAVPLSKIAALTEVDVSTVYKELRRERKAVKQRASVILEAKRVERRAVFESMRASASKLGSESVSGYRYRSLMAWLRRNDAEWLTATRKGTPRSLVNKDERERTRVEYRALFASARVSPNGMRSATYGGHKYETLASWLRKHDAEWLASKLIETNLKALRHTRQAISREQYRFLFQAWRSSPAKAKELAESGHRYVALYSWLKRYDPEWLTAIVAKTRRGTPEDIRNLRTRRRVLFESMRMSALPLTGQNLDGHSYDLLFRWLRKYDASWLARTMKRTRGRRGKAPK